MKQIRSIFLISLICGGCFNNRIGDHPATGVDLRKERMSTAKLARIDSLLTDYVRENKFPGGIFIVVRRGIIVYYKNIGYRSVEPIMPYQKNDIFRIASMTKTVTAVAAMQLYEQGKLGLDDPVSKYIPAFENAEVLDKFNPADSTCRTVPTNKKISIRHLLTHTSGLAYAKPRYGDLYSVYTKMGFTSSSGRSHPTLDTEQIVNKIATLPLAFHPGERYLYGFNIDVLGRVIEVVSGKTLDEYFRENIFEPLQMDDTHFYLPIEKYHRLVQPYDYNGGKLVTYEDKDVSGVSINYPKFQNASAFMGGGGLSSTAIDYTKFLQSLLNAIKGDESQIYPTGKINNRHRLLGRKTMELMMSDQFEKLKEEGKGRNNNIGTSHALGFALTTQTGTEAKSPGTIEWGGAFSTKFFIDPKEELIFVGMSQAIPRYHQEVYGKITAVIYGAID